jgi:hypothetical protein
MLEHALTELFERQTSAAQPPMRASVAQAASDGQALRRRRRASAVVTPLFAAGAVGAIALAAAVPPGHFGSHAAGPRAGAAAKSQQARLLPRHFNPQYQYATFGWLPAGASFTGGWTAPGSINLEADSTIPHATGSEVAGYSWRWSGFARGQCHLHGAVLVCGGQSIIRITSRASEVGGKPAYWGYGPQYPGGPLNIPERLAPHLLAYEYAGGWATLGAPRSGLLKVARNIRMVLAKIRYSVHLAGVPASWQIVNSSYWTSPAGPASYSFSVRASAISHLDVDMGPVGVLPCQGQRLLVAGVRVLVSRDYPTAPSSVTYTLCAPRDHGAWFRINETGRAGIGVVPLFRSHLRLLGLDPAQWTTQPLN